MNSTRFPKAGARHHLRTVRVIAARVKRCRNASLYDTILIMPTTTAVAALRPPTAGYTGLQGGFPGGGANITSLRPPMLPGMSPELPDPASDQANDPAIAAAAAAGLLPVPAMAPGPASASTPLMMPGGIPQSPQSTTPTAPTPSNPWNAPVDCPPSCLCHRNGAASRYEPDWAFLVRRELIGSGAIQSTLIESFATPHAQRIVPP